jgi:hypothetical protein
MMELVATVGKWLILLAIPVATFLAVAFLMFWRPEPDEPVEYLAREDAVLVQMVTVASGLPFDMTVPEFTLYGDGTLIYLRESAEGQSQVIRAKLPGNAVQDLLQDAVGQGFMDFQYDQPRIDSVQDEETTYLYIQTKEAANAVSAYALALAGQPEASGDEFGEFRRISELRQTLQELDPEEVGGETMAQFEAEAVLITAFEDDTSQSAVPVPDWPVASIDLASIAGSSQSPSLVAGEAALQVQELAPPEPLIGLYRQDGRFFGVGYRPVLPFEEHFPEFDFGAN